MSSKENEADPGAGVSEKQEASWAEDVASHWHEYAPSAATRERTAARHIDGPSQES
ncbi:hypothetical protein GCM10017596_01380 [Microbacterium keratanolyticum]|uniref:Uncharacterized protein n=1 Tax=Microbacterium keratanolyticum TaxID=67574 RepID=A0A9W6HQ43_9MICO|nr:hypothetical protein GCM10017596_01380 [Microbacterium keratanolyticum]